ncbi:MAG TPA: bifunctional glycosyltransferase family 2 protein/CDP-glycerol:glycerophosphate glycerophosphotransferase [Mycobacteriales bacterium]|nr:bifunctional glycosyltransferase family 2 protein/CDP-glycerol:glycerophosphate glycerophosphotransferase [Mycobacteriales bacterium]
MTPDVAVVLIGYNDAERLPNAVESVLNQTLSNLEVIIVDDASTDGMGDVADRLAAQAPKVRSIRLPTNSGGCSRPRNVGLEHVRAPHVMFLDSDDVLERHACKNLLLAIEETGADFVSGHCVRVDMDTGNEHGWLRALYDERAAWNGVAENPDLLNDTLCTNKLYRMSFLDKHGIRFPEGVHYEDLAFTVEAYGSATRIAIIPETVYYWRIYASSPQASIHLRRDTIENFQDRLTVHRIIDDFLRREGLHEFKPLIDDRFLRREIKLYLDEMSQRSPAYQEAWIRLARDYLREMDIERIVSQSRSCRLATYLVRQGDLALAVAAADLWINGRVTVPLVRRDDRVYFCDTYLDDPIGREILDVTWLHAHDAPFAVVPFFGRVTELSSQGNTFRLRGDVLNQLGRLPALDELTVTVRVRHEKMYPGTAIDCVTRAISLDANRLTWEAVVDGDTMPRGRSQERAWSVNLRLDHQGEVNGRGLGVAAGVLSNTTGRARRRKPSERQLIAGLSAQRAVVLYDQRPIPALSLTKRITRRVSRLPAVRAVTARLTGRALKTVAYRQVLRRLPLRPNTVVFESHLGKQYSDSPKYLYEKMTAMGLPYRMVWSYQRNVRRFPDSAITVKRDSWRYYYELARAGHIIDNQGFPPVVIRRRGQRYVQTWHGTPFKHMGYDDPGFARAPDETHQQLDRGIRRWDDLVVMSHWSEQVFEHAFRHATHAFRTGYPRNDPLHRANDPGIQSRLKQELGLPEDRKILLYAPTFRRYPKPLVLGNPANSPRIDLRRFEEHLGEEWFIVLRSHYLDRTVVSRRSANIARNMSGYDDISDLLGVADAVLTDYSSVMFDYAITGRPMAFYASDYELYLQLRGSYFDLGDEAPGPIVRDTDQIIDWLSNLDATHLSYQEKYRAFQARYCEFEDGTAAETIIRELFPEAAAAAPNSVGD